MFWLNLLILLVLWAGHTELVVTFLNRIHAFPLGKAFLRKMQHLHDVAVLGFPFILIWCVGLRGPGVLVDGRWSDLSTAWTAYLALCALGAAALAMTSIRWHWQRMQKRALSNHTTIIDVAERLGYRPVGQGPHRRLTRIPGNEIFRVEVSEKTYRLPGLPPEWDGLSILHLSDFHYIGTVDRPFFEEVARISADLEPDLIAFTGDLLDDQRLVEWIPSTLGRLRAPLGCYSILGNHDWYLDPPAIRACLGECGWQDMAGRTVELNHRGRTLVIGGTEMPWMGRHPDFSKTDADAFRLLLSHTPDNLKWARRQGVDLMLSGHNHGGQVVLPVIGPVYSPSLYGCKYAGGVFWKAPTLLYVSRGISGRHALRLGSPPEITKLVLKAGPVETAPSESRHRSAVENSAPGVTNTARL